eukprot:scaffold1794_cov71-Phaeocystis_antarctica.AAC.2
MLSSVSLCMRLRHRGWTTRANLPLPAGRIARPFAEEDTIPTTRLHPLPTPRCVRLFLPFRTSPASTPTRPRPARVQLIAVSENAASGHRNRPGRAG